MAEIGKDGRAGQGRRPPMDRATRAMLALVIGMGVLILAGTTVVIATLVHRTLGRSHELAHGTTVGPSTRLDVSLQIPPGSRIASMTSSGGRLALLVTGGAVDEVVLIDPQDGSRIATIRASP